MPLVRRTIIRDEGAQQGAVNVVDFVGAGVAATVAGGVATVTIAGGGGGGGSTVAGQSTIDFGAFPGASDTSLVVSSASIAAGSRITLSIAAVATSDHSADEHVCEEIDVFPSSPNAGVGFTIYARGRGQTMGPDLPYRRGQAGADAGNCRRYGQWTVNWSYT